MKLPMPFELELFPVHACVDMAEQIFVSPDRAARWTRDPFDVEGSLGFHARELFDGPVLSNNIAIAADAGEMASTEGEGREGQKFHRQERPYRDRAHTNCLFGSEMAESAVLDSKKSPNSVHQRMSPAVHVRMTKNPYLR